MNATTELRGVKNGARSFFRRGLIGVPLAGWLMIAACGDPVGVVPATYQLQQNYPNPFRDTTRIDYGIPGSGTSHIKLIVYDVNKAEVATLVNNLFHPPGSFSVVWDGRDDSYTRVPKGLYLIELSGPADTYSDRRAFRRIVAARN